MSWLLTVVNNELHSSDRIGRQGKKTPHCMQYQPRGVGVKQPLDGGTSVTGT